MVVAFASSLTAADICNTLEAAELRCELLAVKLIMVL
jgi:hypothetical protein